MVAATKTGGNASAQVLLKEVARKAKQMDVAARLNEPGRVQIFASALRGRLAMLPLAEVPTGVKERQAAFDAATAAVEIVGRRPELPGRGEILEKLMVFRRAVAAPPESSC